MPCIIQRLTRAGLEPVDYTANSLAEATQFEPAGVYTVTTTYNKLQVLKFDAHLDRMEDSARRDGWALKLDRSRLRATLRHMIDATDWEAVRFRVTVPHAQPDEFILSLEPFSPPTPELIQTGVRCITAPGMARRNPAAKTNDWARARSQHGLPTGIYEGLLVNEENEILEGFGSNFYAVLNGELRTAGAGVLPGVAQQIVFEVAPSVLPLRREAVTVSDIPNLSEAFMTSSTRGIIPIVAIDDIQIGSGQPGAQTLTLRDRYNAWVAAHLEDL